MKTHNMEQGSPEWFAVRAGKMTASHAQEIGNRGKGLQTYIYEILASKHAGVEEERYTNSHLERGVELEPVARSMYELQKGVTIDQVGFIEYNKYIGCSPDGLIGEDGGIEIKCHNNAQHFRLLVNGAEDIDTRYLWQIQMNLLITGREWWDYVAYNPNFKDDLLIFRIRPSENKHKSLLEGLEVGKKLILEIEKKLKK